MTKLIGIERSTTSGISSFSGKKYPEGTLVLSFYRDFGNYNNKTGNIMVSEISELVSNMEKSSSSKTSLHTKINNRIDMMFQLVRIENKFNIEDMMVGDISNPNCYMCESEISENQEMFALMGMCEGISLSFALHTKCLDSFKESFGNVTNLNRRFLYDGFVMNKHHLVENKEEECDSCSEDLSETVYISIGNLELCVNCAEEFINSVIDEVVYRESKNSLVDISIETINQTIEDCFVCGDTFKDDKAYVLSKNWNRNFMHLDCMDKFKQVKNLTDDWYSQRITSRI
jgi:hypothetical protein